MKHSIALICFDKTDVWQSCKKIKSGILKSYDCLNAEDLTVQYFNLSGCFNSEELEKVILKIEAWNPTHVAFTDYQPHPQKVIARLAKLNSSINVSLIIHIYGDFILFLNQWIKCEESLKKFKSVQFLSSSLAQQDLISKIVTNKNISQLLPFPIDKKDNNVDPAYRDKIISAYSLSKFDKVYLYTGRISHQKNVIFLIKTFIEFQKRTNSSSVLLISGQMDDIGNPYLKIHHPIGYQAYNFNSALEEASQYNIHYLGNIPNHLIFTLYSVADCFVSLSTHQDEDFGMSLLEALVSGLDCGVTAWGGYKSFDLPHVNFEQINFIPVLKLNGPRIKQSDVLKCLIKLNTRPKNDSNRSKIAQAYQDYFGIELTSLKIETLIKNEHKFSGFNSFSKKLGRKISNQNAASAFLKKDYNLNGSYFELYESYF